MKVFRLNTYMALPDDFEGSFEDAVNLWLIKMRAHYDLPENANLSARVANEAFFLNLRYGFTVVAETGIWTHKEKPRGHIGKYVPWVRTDKNPEVCYSSGDTWIK